MKSACEFCFSIEFKDLKAQTENHLDMKSNKSVIASLFLAVKSAVCLTNKHF